jgi:CelD/BcsL family acetyltransferase involved in cellulose biosynthesis
MRENYEIVAIAPLTYSIERLFGLPIKKIKLMGTPHSDYCDFVFSSNKDEYYDLLMKYLLKIPEKWNCIELNDVPANSKYETVSGLSNNTHLIHPCPYIALPQSFEEFLQGLSRNKRKSTQKGIKILETTFNVEFVDCSGTEYFEEGMNWLFKLHQKKWMSQGFPGVFASPKIRGFHLEIARAFSEKKWLGLFSLKLSDRTVAVVYGFRYNSKFYSYLSGYDPEYAKYSVANLLRAKIMDRCIKDHFTEFDFLRGDETYKSRWNASIRWNQKHNIN